MKKQQPTFQRKTLCQAIVLATAMTAASASYAQITISDERNVTQYVGTSDVTVTELGVVDVTGNPLPGDSDGEDTGQVEGIYANSSPYTGTLVNDGDIYAGARNNTTTSNPTITTDSITDLGLVTVISIAGNWDTCNTSGSANNYSCRNFDNPPVSRTFTAQAKAVRVGELQGTITNNGNITANAEIDSNPSNVYSGSQSAIGIYADSITPTGSISNSGNIIATADDGQVAIGVEVAGNMSGNIANDSYILATAPLASSGTITGPSPTSAITTFTGPGGSAAGIYMDGDVSGTVTNNGGIIAAANYAVGISAAGNVSGSISNDSYIGAWAVTSAPLPSGTGTGSVNGTAVGIYINGDVSGSVSNSGQIFVAGKNAAGIVVDGSVLAGSASTIGSILNSGTISLLAPSSSNSVFSSYNGATGIAVSTVDGGLVTNNGYIGINGGMKRQRGISVGDLNSGSVINGNSGSISISNSSSYSHTGIYVGSISGDASISNSGSINVNRGVGIYLDSNLDNSATIVNAGSGGIYINSGTGIHVNGSMSSSAAIVNSGTIDVTSGYGVYVEDYMYSSAAIINNGQINVDYGTGIYVDSTLYSSALISNSASASIGVTSGYGIYLEDYMYSSAAVINNGQINVDFGTGIYVSSTLYSSAAIQNNGTINVTTGKGIYAYDMDGNASISNAGSINVDYGQGIYIEEYMTSNASIVNATDGVINVMGGTGIYVSSSMYSSASIANNGTINITSYGYGIYASDNLYSNAAINNNGLISVNSGTGIYVGGYLSESAAIVNSGTIDASGSESSGNGIYVADGLFNNASITNSGTIDVDRAAGIYVSSSEGAALTGSALISNTTDASINATSYGDGIYVYGNLYDSAAIINNGYISAYGGTGINVSGELAATASIANNGTIDISGSGNGIYVADGLFNSASITNAGTIDVSTGAGIYVSYSEGPALTSSALISNTTDASINISSYGYGIYVGEDLVSNAAINNNGMISVNNGTGIYVDTMTSSAAIDNAGTIDVSNGIGIYAYALVDDAVITNAGTINVDDGVGIYVSYTVGTSESDNAAVINTTNASINVSDGTGIYAYYLFGNGSVSNQGLISIGDSACSESCSTDGYGIYAYYLDDNATISNQGTINIKDGIGIYASYLGSSGSGSPALINSGTIDITSGTGMYGYYMYENAQVINKGTINIDDGYGMGGSSMHSSAAITNTTNASINVGSGSGIWAYFVTGTPSVTNKGTINVDDGTGIWASDYSSSITSAEVINSGAITVGGSEGYGIYANGSAISVSNSGTITAPDATGVSADGNVENTADGQIIADYNYIGGNLVNAGILSGDLSVSGNASNSNTIDLTYDGGKGGYIGGDFTQTADGILIFEVADKETYSRLYVDGTATVDGTIGFNLTAQDQLHVGDTIDDLVSATSLVSGDTFASEDNSILLDIDVVKDGDTIDATVVTGVTLEEIISTSPESQFTDDLAELLDTWIGDPGGLNPEQDEIINALLNPANSITDLQVLLTQYTPALSGHSLQALNSVLASVASIINNRVSSVAAMQRGASSGDTNFSSKAFWIRPFYNDSEQKSHSNVYGYDAEASGLVFGIDGAVNDDWRLGAAFAYGTNKVDATGAATGQQLKSDSYQLSLYGNWTLAQSNFANFQLAFGQNDNDTQRVIGSDVNRGNFNSYFVQAAAEYGQSYAMNDKLSLTPSASAVYTYVNEKGYTETGTGPTLIVDSRNADSFLLGIDAELAYNIELGQHPAALTAHVGVAYDTQAESSDLSASFTAGGPKFITPGLKPDDTTVRGGVGLQIFTEKAWDLSINYDIDSRQSFTGQTASVKVNIPF